MECMEGWYRGGPVTSTNKTSANPSVIACCRSSLLLTKQMTFINRLFCFSRSMRSLTFRSTWLCHPFLQDGKSLSTLSLNSLFTYLSRCFEFSAPFLSLSILFLLLDLTPYCLHKLFYLHCY